MNIRNLIRMSFDMLLLRSRTVIGLLGIAGVACLLVCSFGEMYIEITYREKIINEIISVQHKDLFFVKQDYISPDDENVGERENAFFSELSIEPGIILSTLLKVNDRITYGEDGKTVDVYSLYTDTEMLRICGIKGEYKAGDVIVGSRLKGILKEGERITSLGREYTVVAFSDENTKVVPTSIYSSPEVCFEIDNALVILNTDGVFGTGADVYMEITEDADLSAIKAKIAELNKKYNVGFTLQNIDDALEIIRDNKMKSANDKVVIVYFAVLMAVLSVATMNMVDVLSNRREYGILWSCGYTKRDLSKIIIIEDCLIFVIACFAAWTIRGVMLQYEKSVVKGMRLDIHYRYIHGYNMAFVIFCIFLSSICAMLYLNRRSPSDLMREMN